VDNPSSVLLSLITWGSFSDISLGGIAFRLERPGGSRKVVAIAGSSEVDSQNGVC
jgi:hypothetical protein